MLPLSGLRILAFESWGAGSYKAMMLAKVGAEVISIENAATWGNALRKMGARIFLTRPNRTARGSRPPIRISAVSP